MISYPNAKINIGLKITGRRPDGYHNLETVFYPVNYCDCLEIAEAPELSFSSSGIAINCSWESNLCIKAYRLLKKSFPAIPPVKMHLHKKIPFGAGLGGGSADGAFALKMLNQLFAIGLDTVKLEQMAAELGADCPFFISNKPVIAEGIGNIFSPIKLEICGMYIAIAKPDVSVSTAEAYAGACLSPGGQSLRELENMPPESWKLIASNGFAESVYPKYPAIAALENEMYGRGAIYASMSGSGSAVYGIFRNKPDFDASQMQCSSLHICQLGDMQI
jgi:4-diphosphocytidyl-2-C-methyl-D-erythritol kinase